MSLKWLLPGLLAVAPLAHAQDADDAQAKQKVQTFVSSLHFEDGNVALGDAKAHVDLGSDFRYLAHDDARRVLEDLWGNPPDDDIVGLVVPRSPSLAEDGSWAVVVTQAHDGHVSDDDAQKIDYTDLLADMKKGTDEANDERKKGGFGALHIVGWAVPPRYDASSKKLYWAKEVDFEGETTHTLNYDIRVLGRDGYLSFNAVSAMADLPTVKTGMEQLLPRVSFDSGARYADFDKSTDKVAAYGLAALVAGGIAAKTGLFAKLGLLLLGLKKLLIPLFLAITAGFRKITGMFRKSKGVVS
ncbi:DUF2167 domain-containing protein [Lysobacter sp. HA18]